MRDIPVDAVAERPVLRHAGACGAALLIRRIRVPIQGDFFEKFFKKYGQNALCILKNALLY
jgi:hypothetical protein